MNDGIDLLTALDATTEEINAVIDQLAELGKAEAIATADYRVKLATAERRLRDEESYPVTLVSDLARGEKEVARSFIQRKVAEANYWAAKDLLQQRWREAEIIRDQIRREFSRSDDGAQ